MSRTRGTTPNGSWGWWTRRPRLRQRRGRNRRLNQTETLPTIVRPANLCNMAPDHTLILVNRKRRNRAAVIA